MYKIIIVEDEDVIREGLKTMVDWASLGYEMVGEASNGKEAFDLISKLQPHIIMTDIMMPVCNGIELMQKIKNAGIDSKVIVFSGYDEFEYARSALDTGAIGYLLKPLNLDKLAEMLINTKCEIDQKEKEHDRNAKLMNLLKEQFISDIIYGAYRPDDIIAQAEDLEIYFNSDCYYPVIVKEVSSDRQSYDKDKSHIDLLKLNISNLMCELDIKLTELYIYVGKESEIVLLLGFNNITDFSQIDENLKHIIEKTISESVNIVIGQICKEISEVNSSFELMYNVLSTYNSTRKSGIIIADTTGNYSNNIEIKVDRKVIKEIKEYINDHFNEALSLDVLSSISNLHPIYVSKIFKSETGINLIDYITDIRMKNAKDLLKDIKLKTYEVCLKVGYTSSKHFSRIFKAYTGMTPSEYRENT